MIAVDMNNNLYTKYFHEIGYEFGEENKRQRPLHYYPHSLSHNHRVNLLITQLKKCR